LEYLEKNAIKFTYTGGKITIILTNPTADKLQIDFVDNGIGMDSFNISKIFSAFQQGDASIAHKFGGLGLGLHIATELMKFHNGSLTAFSEGLGKGSTFSVCLPTLKSPQLVEIETKIKSQIQETNPKKILIVEDNQSTMLVLIRILSKLGHHVKSASCVKEALEDNENHLVDLLICDIGLPDGSGLDVVRKLKDRNPQLKAIALSGYGSVEDNQNSLEAGFQKHLVKPIQTIPLKLAIHNLFS